GEAEGDAVVREGAAQGTADEAVHGERELPLRLLAEAEKPSSFGGRLDQRDLAAQLPDGDAEHADLPRDVHLEHGALREGRRRAVQREQSAVLHAELEEELPPVESRVHPAGALAIGE